MLEFDGRRTEQRIQELQRYYEENILVDRRFICSLYRECRKSAPQGLNFYRGQLSHVGRRYDLKKDGQDLRLVVTSISYGHKPPNVNMSRRLQMIVNDTGMSRRYYSDGMHGGRNPHMRGTTLLLKRILLGKQSLKAYDNWENEFVGAQVEQNHIFNMFSLVNFVLCSAFWARLCYNGCKYMVY